MPCMYAEIAAPFGMDLPAGTAIARVIVDPTTFVTFDEYVVLLSSDMITTLLMPMPVADATEIEVAPAAYGPPVTVVAPGASVTLSLNEYASPSPCDHRIPRYIGV